MMPNSNSTVFPLPVGANSGIEVDDAGMFLNYLPLMTCKEYSDKTTNLWKNGTRFLFPFIIFAYRGQQGAGTYAFKRLAVSKHVDCTALNTPNLNIPLYISATESLQHTLQSNIERLTKV